MLFKRKTTDLELLPPPVPEDIEKPEGFDEIVRESRNSPEAAQFDDVLDTKKKKGKAVKIKKGGKKTKPKNTGKETESFDSLDIIKFDEMPDITDDISTIPLLSQEIPYPKPKELDDAKNEINEAIEKIKRKEKKSVFSRIFWKKNKAPESVSYQAPIPADNLSAVKAKIAMIREALMKFDTENAKMLYKEAMDIYNSMSHEDQAEVYNDIKEVYFERKSAEQFKSR